MEPSEFQSSRKFTSTPPGRKAPSRSRTRRPRAFAPRAGVVRSPGTTRRAGATGLLASASAPWVNDARNRPNLQLRILQR